MSSLLPLIGLISGVIPEFLWHFQQYLQYDLAKRIGVSRQTINSIEANRYVPSTVLALKLSEVFGKPISDSLN